MEYPVLLISINQFAYLKNERQPLAQKLGRSGSKSLPEISARRYVQGIFAVQDQR